MRRLDPDLTERETNIDADLVEHWAVSTAINKPGNDEDAGLIKPA